MSSFVELSTWINFAVTVVFAYIVYNTVHFVVVSRRRVKGLYHLPGEIPSAIWGNLAEFPGPGEAGLAFMYKKISETKERIVKVQYGPFQAAATVLHYDTARAILKTSEPKPTEFGVYRFLLSWLGDGLLLAKGQKWARNRRLLTPAFHFDILKPYTMVNNQCTDILLEKMSMFSKTGEYFEVFSHISHLTLDIILKCAFSYDIDCQNMGAKHPYVQAVTELGEGVVYRMLRLYLYPDLIYYLTPAGRRFKKNSDYVHSVAEEVIRKRRSDLATHGDSLMRHHKYIDFLDILLKAKDTNGHGLSDLDIRNEVDTFLFEGHDTTASAISWTLYSIAQHPNIQTKCQKEVDAFLEGRDSSHINWDDLNSLPYLAMCIKEGMRLHSTVSFIQRVTTKDMHIDGYFLPAGTLVHINIYMLHHNPHIWESPNEFRPERYSPENLEKMDPYQSVPFSAGPRNCIGQNFAMHEMKVCIARILHHFTLSIDPHRVAKREIKAVMKTEDGMYLKAEPRIPFVPNRKL